MSTGKSVLAGMIGGLAGGMVMSMGMMIGQRAGVIETPMPLKVERELEKRAGVAEKTSPQQEKALAFAEHMLISGGFGAVYGLARTLVSAPLLLTGMMFGLLVYAVNLAGAGPALDLAPGPWEEKPQVVGRRVMMHVVYGVVTALVADQIEQR